IEEQAFVMHKMRPGMPGRDVQFDDAIARHPDGDDVLDARRRVIAKIPGRRDPDQPFLAAERAEALRDAPVPRDPAKAEPDMRQEEILEPGLAIVDPHHHLWDHPGSRYLLDELLADVNSGHNIVATVFIQCGSGYRTSGPEEMRCIGESEFVRAIAENADRRGTKTKICAGIVSFADLRLPNADAVLEGQIAAAGGRFRGIRQIAAYDPAIVGASSYVPPPDLMNDPNFRRGLKRLPAYDLT